MLTTLAAYRADAMPSAPRMRLLSVGMLLSLAAHGSAAAALALFVGSAVPAGNESQFVVEFVAPAPPVAAEPGPTPTPEPAGVAATAPVPDIKPATTAAPAPVPKAVPVAAPPVPRRTAAQLTPVLQAIRTPAVVEQAAPAADVTAGDAPREQSIPVFGVAAALPDAGTVTTAKAVAAAPLSASAMPAAGSAPPVVTQARFRQTPRPPDYPARARAMEQQGVSVVRALVDTDGRSREIRLWLSSGYDALDRAALAAVRTWQFEAARLGDRPVLAWVEIPVRFELR